MCTLLHVLLPCLVISHGNKNATVTKSWHVEKWFDLGCGIPSISKLGVHQFWCQAASTWQRSVSGPYWWCWDLYLDPSIYAEGGHIQHVHMMHGGQIWQRVEAAWCRETSWPCAPLQRHYKMPNDGETLRTLWAIFLTSQKHFWSNWEGATLRGHFTLFGPETLFLGTKSYTKSMTQGAVFLVLFYDLVVQLLIYLISCSISIDDDLTNLTKSY